MAWWSCFDKLEVINTIRIKMLTYWWKLVGCSLKDVTNRTRS